MYKMYTIRMVLVFLLILLAEAGPTAACSSSCSSRCYCYSRGLTSVPQDLPTNVTELYLHYNVITTLNQSDFSRHSTLTTLQLQYNQISLINSGAFYNLTRLTHLYLYNNRLTSLRSDMFVGLDSLQILYLYHNNIHSIEAGTFNATPQLRELQLQYNNISNIAAGALATLSRLQCSGFHTLRMDSNQMATLPSVAYDILASVPSVHINNNPWQCDCRMLPFKLRMNGDHPFDNQITCVGPANLRGKNLLSGVNADDLICEDTTSALTPSAVVEMETSTSGSYTHLVLISGFLGALIGGLLTSTVFLAVWCHRRRRESASTSVPGPTVAYSNTESQTCTAVTMTTSVSRAEEYDDVTTSASRKECMMT
ncbi:PREDICTED: slit homolog 2 protein-like [Branchiostoma belcheri]|uniref:Slit homolog 2 protein-like n=1 Tax=Branchiostoma belcheri TaxID=7741 RepID=A0A6P5ATK3_BRABE|nr:PREDICTED: slit homolog 2 protein-like [Branchiostoma belcheri]